MSDLTLIIPAKNEKESLPKVLDELVKYNLKKNIILEASDKTTIEAIKTYDCRIIFQDSKGYGDALKKGIETVETKFFCIFNRLINIIFSSIFIRFNSWIHFNIL